MPTAEERRQANRNPMPAMPGGNPMDDLSVPGLDNSEDLMDSLITEAGEFSEEAILATGLPDDYDPSGGLDFEGQSGAQMGRVFRMDGSESNSAAPAAGSTRVGLLPKVGRQQVPVASKLAAAPPPPEPEADDVPTEEETSDDLLPDDILPDDDDAPAEGLGLPEAEEELDDSLMAELSEGVREVAVHPTPAPVIPPSPSPHRQQLPSLDNLSVLGFDCEEDLVDSMAVEAARPSSAPLDQPRPRQVSSRLPFPPPSDDVTLPLPKIAPGIEILRPGVRPGPAAWVCPLDGHDDGAFLSVCHELRGDLHLSQATLLPIRGGTPRAAAMKPVISAARPGLRISSAHHLQHREAGEAVLFYASTRLYSHGETQGLLLVEAAKRKGSVAIRRLCLFDPSLLLG